MVSTDLHGSRLIGTIITEKWVILASSKQIYFYKFWYFSCRGSKSFGRYGHMDEHSYRYHFKKEFDWIEFNRQYVAENCSDEVIIGFDPSYITKRGSLLTELVISILAAVVNTKEGLRLVTSQLLM